MKKKPDKDFFKCVIKHQSTQEVIDETVIKANKIVINTLQFIKLYCIEQYKKNKTLPDITEEFINACMKTLCVSATNGRPPSKKTTKLKLSLKTFYDK
jgi:hypothetical protein